MARVLAPWLTTAEVSRFMDADDRKLRGGYYTPAEVASVLALWAVRRDDAQVLEPSCGDGVVVEAVASRLGSGGRVTGCELFAEEAAKAASRGGDHAQIITGDFFNWFLAAAPYQRFDAVVGNPPFLRFQSFPEAHREAAFAIMRKEGLKPSRLTNAWVPFVVAATAALAAGGRLALVLPAELLQVTYAGELRAYLARKYRRLVIVTFKRILFADTQQETVLLFGVREDTAAARMKWIELDDVNDLSSLDLLTSTNGVPADLDHAKEKWTQYYLTPDELALIRRVERSDAVTTLGALAEVDVGVVTGSNDFFVLTDSNAREFELGAWCDGLVARSAHVPGVQLSASEWEELRRTHQRCLLLRLPVVPAGQLPAEAQRYVARGVELGIHQGFKCRIRLPIWWQVPSVWVPDAFLLRQIHDGPRIIANGAKVTCTDTIHRLRLKSGVNAGWLAPASLNSLTFAFAEIRGRSYGGGVLELEPSEAESLPFPRPGLELPLAEIDRLVRERKTEAALDLVDERLLIAGAGLSRVDASALRAIWTKLRRRRLARKTRARDRVEIPATA